MELRIYESVEATDYVAYGLRKDKGDSWRRTIKGDLIGKYYTVHSYQNDEWSEEAPGIFAKAVGISGGRAAIIDIAKANPEGWADDLRPAMTDKTDIVVYETHLRDFTMSPVSGI
ncbi:MAG: hypothetical protein IJU35_05975 [Paludibacteraceae bacterium]|nr:hypothetical protein [Paludibacteraceae bacterium]